MIDDLDISMSRCIYFKLIATAMCPGLEDAMFPSILDPFGPYIYKNYKLYYNNNNI